MNKRIEALKKLATKEVWGDNPPADCPEFDGHELDADMFAELIVRECAEYAEQELDMAGYKKKFMLKHFGVEE